MDAKPQRPTRALRVYGDENAIPPSYAQKTLHQRHKSSPNLSTLAQTGAMRVAAKRTALGDASNTANVSRPSKDDSVIASKGDGVVATKLAPLPYEKKATNLLRPAQRPISVMKGLINNAATTSASIPIKQPLAEVQQPTQPVAQLAHTRKVLQKRSTAVLQDIAPVPKEDQATIEPQNPKSSITAIAPLYHNLEPPPPPPHQHVELDSKLWRTRSRPTDEQPKRVSIGPSVVHVPLEQVDAVRSDGLYIDNHGKLQLYEFTDELDAQEVILPDEEGVAVNQEHGQDDEGSIKKSTSIVPDHLEAHKMQSFNSRRQQHVPISEPEEYWDDEAEEENYDEEGYVTARSYKSRGENSTSGATTVLFPNPNQKTRKELAAAKAFMEAAKAADELDDETWDTTMVAEYGDEIFQYMMELEIKLLPNAHYMDNQAEIQWSMRSVLMDWLVQVHHRFGLLPETLFLCCNYIDRFLSCKIVSLGKLQLVGATAIFVAAKYEEINCPSVQEIVYMVDNGYTADEILKAERFMLAMLQFELGWPGPMSFLRRISKADDYDLETRTLAKYFLEVTIMDERFVGSPPSFLAAGAHCLARIMLKKGHWTVQHVYFSNYTFAQLHSVMLLMLECCDDPQKHHCAIYDKYADKRYKRASQFVQSELNKGFQPTDINSNPPALCSSIREDKIIYAY